MTNESDQNANLERAAVRSTAGLGARGLILFAGGHYYPQGGWSDMKGIFATRDECAKRIVEVGPDIMSDMGYSRQQPGKHDVWWQIVDAETLTLVEEGVGAPNDGDLRQKETK